MIRSVCLLLTAFLVCDTAVYLMGQDHTDLVWTHQQGIIRLAKNKFHYVPRECVVQTQGEQDGDQE